MTVHINVKPEGLDPDAMYGMAKAERARMRAVHAHDLLRQTEAWEWVERLCEQEAEARELVILDPNAGLEHVEVVRKVAEAAVWRDFPRKIRAYRDQFNTAVQAANHDPQQGEEHE